MTLPAWSGSLDQPRYGDGWLDALDQLDAAGWEVLEGEYGIDPDIQETLVDGRRIVALVARKAGDAASLLDMNRSYVELGREVAGL
jgi:hypothetical protein